MPARTSRYARQLLLPEVGESGQTRLSEARVDVPEGPEAEVAVDYLVRAGVTRVSRSAGRTTPPEQRPSVESFPHAAVFRHGSSAVLGAGAWQALSRLRDLLGVAAEPSPRSFTDSLPDRRSRS